MTTQDLSGRVALISGSGRGIGRAIALVMAERGADIVLHDIDGAEVDTVAAEIEALGQRAHRGVCDVTISTQRRLWCAPPSPHSATSMCSSTMPVFPAARLPSKQLTRRPMTGLLDIHVKGAFFLTQAAVEGMKLRRFGRIINISSNRGMVGHSLSPHYSAAKAALLGLTKAWARELAPYGILVNAVAPGVVRTHMTTRYWNGATSRGS